VLADEEWSAATQRLIERRWLDEAADRAWAGVDDDRLWDTLFPIS
jgi:hypothetical protein